MAYLLSSKNIFNISNELRQRGNNVVFTHGTFDLFHVGHSYLLKKSKKIGDVLIVGVDTDDRVKRYKDSVRPIIPDYQRASLVSDLREVDFVFLIDDNNREREKFFLELYSKLNPNVITHGPNFLFKDQFKKRHNQIKGVTYKEIPRVFKNAPSTTAIINKITSIHKDGLHSK